MNGDWHVFEAKVMSTNQLNSKIRGAKEQVQRVGLINGTTPQALNACATYFSDHQILTYLVDPNSKNENDFAIKRSKYFDAIYRPIFLFENALDRELKLTAEDGFKFYAINLKGKGIKLTVGIEKEIHNLIQKK